MLRNCKFCNDTFEPKKPKAVFCSPKCRVYWHRENKVPIPIEKGIGKKAEIEMKEKLGVDFLISDQFAHTCKQWDNDETIKRIESIKAEKIPKDRDTALGRKAWALEQQKRIQELENQLK